MSSTLLGKLANKYIKGRTKCFAVGYEYSDLGLQSYKNTILKLGFNNWQGRIIEKNIS
ncbi:hypothetical protein [uncultured Polaribacter sp.]|uniref:hypothetical protein n=1 Tax=uncultured Polaribacter sp. TaxID=174711 RepID=UPI002613A273|nr:hypothetical protein [uncultured Polaribacter sp.]